jgi:glycosyltransferase involved in cell wall biosynthesis
VIAGSQPEKYWSRFAEGPGMVDFDARVGIHSFVEDLRPFYHRARVVVAPLAISAGTNIKVLEALACGKALVTTPVGGQGLNLRDGHDALIREDWHCFAQAVGDLLIDDQFARSLGMRARRTAEAQFSWRKIAHQAYTSYIEVAA